MIFSHICKREKNIYQLILKVVNTSSVRMLLCRC